MDVGSPFLVHDHVLHAVKAFFKAPPLSTTRKMPRLSTGQIGAIVDQMHIGGMSMLQARFTFAHMALTGTRTPHFTHLRWSSVRLMKTLCYDANNVRSAIHLCWLRCCVVCTRVSAYHADLCMDSTSAVCSACML